MGNSPVYSLKFTLSWIFVYLIILLLTTQIMSFFIAAYLSLWILNIVIELVERYIYKVSSL